MANTITVEKLTGKRQTLVRARKKGAKALPHPPASGNNTKNKAL
ncbi:hypothetical protein BN439_3146 [Erwinia amylovora Ea644]|uniref:Uncharacterized protein n=2 Tax=Erwinia amylovora TaxID=552 RepID=D4I010_ERWAC|nr:hypothetical protein EHX00_0695 [Erwinia amylovora]CBA22645.1 hypothetical protein predicted by Glimmer/Critica [Erwinia amylovora CFBP1430]CBX81793.1 hypothetical protein predicted by Glimmer/Critica [Erwinia amylovora ATCC BAA-2158]CCO87339.1 hypothetical protein BN434_2969 [Erwinia amylovora CFBP 2585]CCP04180.1 hypothetical protein BN439_3146 [Erwinia amylovora Ea644]